jgi:hypothetical protein
VSPTPTIAAGKPAGAKAWDTGMTIVETAKKVGVSFYTYLSDRISGARRLPALADGKNKIEDFAPALLCPSISSSRRP